MEQSRSLIALAQEPAYARRCELLRRIGDLFLASDARASTESRAEFARTASLLLDQLDTEVRREFAERFADAPGAPAELMARLAHDVIAVARPVLCRSAALDDADLLTVAMVRGDEHLKAISQRDALSVTVTDVIVQRGEDETLVLLTLNAGARFSRRGFERLAERADAIPALRAPLASRPDTPLDLTHEMLVFVEDAVRDAILERFSGVSPGELDEALRCARARAQARRRKAPEIAQARLHAEELRSSGRLTKAAVVELLRDGEETMFVAGLALLIAIDPDVAWRLWRAPSLEPLAMAIRTGGGERAFFVSIALARVGSGVTDPKGAKELGDAFDRIDPATARRVARFWRGQAAA